TAWWYHGPQRSCRAPASPSGQPGRLSRITRHRRVWTRGAERDTGGRTRRGDDRFPYVQPHSSATVSAEGPQGPFPATASAEGAQLNAPPSSGGSWLPCWSSQSLAYLAKT